MSTAPDPAPAPTADDAPSPPSDPSPSPGGARAEGPGKNSPAAPSAGPARGRRRTTAPAADGDSRTPARGRKGAERREALLDAAEEVLVAEGGPEWTMRAVAAAAGVRLGHLQYYFPTHADLVAAVLERVLRRSAERLAPLLSTDPDAPGAPTGVVTTLLAEQEDARLMRLFVEVWALAARDTTVAAAVRGFYDDYRTQVTAFLARRHPHLPEEERRARAGVFIMLVEGASLFRSDVAGAPDPTTDTTLVRTALTLLGP
ncbi:transcriptional regulator, TetR family [Streptomyces sp. TLI_053]|uniref:TetR/AcrR family transcriptional regulator n=1 Tax=Streptomyces sp. TLI_053 TaxID=1855352 RepID=UPI00087D13AC|nr:TetR family transcriptional regulator [Streptomyces sp. TLI_053]SDT03798.1 transcriptional regulator, TetR family [Streptomyces sp. TLI_053]